MKALVVGSSSVLATELGNAVQCDFWGRSNPQQFASWRSCGNLGDPVAIQALARDIGTFSLESGAPDLHLVQLQGVSSADWSESMNVNMVSVAQVAIAFCDAVRDSGKKGSVVLIGSTASYFGGKIPYAMTKASLHGLMAALNRTYAPSVRTNIIVPGAFVGRMTADWPEEKTNRVAGGTFARRLARAAEIADCICFLMKNPYICSAVINSSAERL